MNTVLPEPATPAKPKRRSRLRLALGVLALLYAGLLLASHLSRVSDEDPQPLPAGRRALSLPAVGGDGEVRFAWIEWQDEGADPEATPLVLLHGSPGSAGNFSRLARELAQSRRVLAPDLPGFGASSREIPDYSIVAHARYVRAWLQELGIERAHLLGFSMGGGVALHLWEMDPDLVASLSLVSSIGVQELELLGSYHVNRLLHGAQLLAIRLLLEGFPHFGRLDRFMLDVPYARNFYDSDQRPLRDLLHRFEPPMLVVHGEQDFLVPAAAAREHARLAPHSELLMLETGHFFVFTEPRLLAEPLREFLRRADAGEAPRRRDAGAERIAASRLPFDPSVIPAWSGPAWLVVLLLLAVATLISEDLTCIAAGVLVAQGRIGFVPATVACYVGIVIGDLLLFWAGRRIGRPIVRRPPFKWWIDERAIEQSSKWLRRWGGPVILLTRTLPGARLPTNVAAGLLRTDFWRFCLYFVVAGLFWTPLLVGASAWLGESFIPRLGQLRHEAIVAVILLALIIWSVRRLVVPLATWKGRRRALGRWRRLRRWEFWPSWVIYPPIVLHVLWLGIRHRCLTLCTAANPLMPAGGIVGESKAAILRAIPADLIPAWRLVPPGEPVERAGEVQAFREEHGLEYPLVLKPESGERGRDVAVVRSDDDVVRYFETLPRNRPTLVQEHVPGFEVGLFWARGPEDARGEILSLAEKRPPVLVGDGERSLEELILADERAVILADVYLRENPQARELVPALDEPIQLVDVGTHARGSIFLDRHALATEELRSSVERAVARFERPEASDGGFDFGRFDLRFPDQEAVRAGGPFRILEVNGLTSEPAHMYDPRASLRAAWRALALQWSRAFAIGAQRRRAGQRPVTLRELWAIVRRARRTR
ncbi:MAG TPA: alpha/beta fold hydrolase [Thermoanaerobaculia bacterium]|nr:alpha/beta fold hydrolase [Thermoanaerobaculia bacterium]